MGKRFRLFKGQSQCIRPYFSLFVIRFSAGLR